MLCSCHKSSWYSYAERLTNWSECEHPEKAGTQRSTGRQQPDQRKQHTQPKQRDKQQHQHRRVPEGGLAEGGLGFAWKSVVFGVWAAPGGFKTIQKGGGRNPPAFWMVLKPPGAAQTPKTTDLQPIQNPPLLNPPLATRGPFKGPRGPFKGLKNHKKSIFVLFLSFFDIFLSFFVPGSI